MNNIIGSENINESLQIHFLIYKITNNVNGKYYIGQHQTDNPYDDYMGSGRLILKALKKYDLSCFTKEILFDFDNKNDMNNKELELVPLSLCYPYNPLSYNLTEGGRGGNNIRFDIPEIKEKYIQKIRNKLNSLSEDEKNERRIKLSKIIKAANETLRKNNPDYFKRSDEFKHNLSVKRSGRGNPMYGKNSQDYMTDSAIKNKCYKEKIAQLGRRSMINPKTNDCKHVKPSEFQKYLNLGYIFKAKKYNIN